MNSIEELPCTPARSFYYQADGRIYDVPEGVEHPDDLPAAPVEKAVHSPSSSCSTVSAAAVQQTEQQETSTAKKKKKVRQIQTFN